MKKHMKLLSIFLIVILQFTAIPSTSSAAAVKINKINNQTVTVYVNESYSLPKTVQATLSDNTKKNVAVIWKPNTISTIKTGKYVYKGTVKGYKNSITLTLIVKEKNTQITPTPTPSPTPIPVYSDPELARAVSLKIGTCQENTPITYQQFFGMLDIVVSLAEPSTASKWKGMLTEARKSDKIMLREEGMLALFYAAETLGAPYNDTNSEWWKTNEKIVDAWSEMTWKYPLFPDWKQKVQLGTNTWNDKMTAAYFYSMGRTSLYSDKTVFDFDSKSVSMHPSASFMYEEALLAALRLYDSAAEAAERIPTKEDEKILAKAEDRRDAILSSAATVTIKGTSYYVSNSGNDNNDGLSPATAWATIDRVNSTNLAAGDGILFERGGIYRGIPKYRSGISYSAYGSGDKPKIYGSPESGADPSKWNLLEGTKNIWVFYKDMYDTSCIVFDNDSSWAVRQTAIWDGTKYVDKVDQKTPFDVKKMGNLQFFSAVDYTGYSTKEAYLGLDRKGKLYIRCDTGNPGSVYQSIEFLSNPMRAENGGGWGLIMVENGVVDNLCLKYFNQCGIVLDSNSAAQNCEVAWVGGCIINYNGAWLGTDMTTAIQGGDGIVIDDGSNCKAINNYVHHTYDSAITNELASGLSDSERFSKNMTIKGNLAEKCSGGILLCDWESLQSNRDYLQLFDNILIEDNYIMYGGYGWSHQVIDYAFGSYQDVNNGNCNLMFGFPAKSGKNISVINNVFYLSKYALVGGRNGRNGNTQRYQITFSGNTYVQNSLGILIQYPPIDDYAYAKLYINNGSASKVITDILGDKTGVVIN